MFPGFRLTTLVLMDNYGAIPCMTGSSIGPAVTSGGLSVYDTPRTSWTWSELTTFGFESFWSVRFGAETAREGEWRPGPRDGLFDSMRTALGNLPIVAEDLGVITPEVDRLRLRHQIPGMKVLQFAVGDPEFDIDDVVENCVCYTGTHDNDTTVGWFNGGNEDTRSEQEIVANQQSALKASGGTPETIHLDMIRLAFSSEAKLAIAPMQDYLGLGSEARLNVPGTTSGNWRWRVSNEQLSYGICESTAQLVEEMSRF